MTTSVLTTTVGAPARRSMRAARPLGRCTATLALLFLLTSTQGTADAAFPGKNGRIAYSVEENGGGDLSNFWVETVRRDGRARRRIGVSGEAPAFSPRGRRIAYGSFESGQLRTMGPSGERDRQLTNADNVEFDGSADWSPTGRRLVFVRGYIEGTTTDLWIHYARGERLLFGGAGDPAWSVRGDIAFTRMLGYTPLSGIWLIRPNGSGLRQLSLRGFTPDWSPTGRRIVFRSGSDIASMRADGSGFRRLTRGRAVDSDPAFSPNGRRIVFVRNGSTVLTMTLRGGHLKRLARHTGESGITDITVSGPDWQPLRR
jgi:Tol biopolymer transport system component